MHGAQVALVVLTLPNDYIVSIDHNPGGANVRILVPDRGDKVKG